MDVIIAWLMSHAAIVAGAIVAVLDLIFALVPSWESNGILHAIYLWLKGFLPGKP